MFSENESLKCLLSNCILFLDEILPETFEKQCFLKRSRSKNCTLFLLGNASLGNTELGNRAKWTASGSCKWRISKIMRSMGLRVLHYHFLSRHSQHISLFLILSWKCAVTMPLQYSSYYGLGSVLDTLASILLEFRFQEN